MYFFKKNCNDKCKLRSEEQFCSFSLHIHREKVPLTDMGPGKTPQKGNIYCIFLFLTSLPLDFYPDLKSSSLPFSNDRPRNPHLCDPIRLIQWQGRCVLGGRDEEGRRACPTLHVPSSMSQEVQVHKIPV